MQRDSIVLESQCSYVVQIGLRNLEVEGQAPEWLQGDFYRSGPGIYKGYAHYFDGLAMLVNFRFASGYVSWQQCYIQSTDYKRYQEAGEPQMLAFKWTPGMWKASLDAMKDLLGLGIGTFLGA
jgi:carotenoid cleavage dioxygenase-like enzyme